MLPRLLAKAVAKYLPKASKAILQGGESLVKRAVQEAAPEVRQVVKAAPKPLPPPPKPIIPKINIPRIKPAAPPSGGIIKQGLKVGAAQGVAQGGFSGVEDNASPAEIARRAAVGGVIGGAAGAAIPGAGVAAVKGTKATIKFSKNLGEDGFIASRKAKDFAKAESQGKTFTSADNKPRFEVSDKNAQVSQKGVNKFNKGDVTSLHDLIPHKEFDNQYKGLAKSVRIVADDSLPAGQKALSDTASRTIRLNHTAIKDPEDLRNTLLHERQHFVQEHEGLARGATPEASKAMSHPELDRLNQVSAKIAPDLKSEAAAFARERNNVVNNPIIPDEQRPALLRAVHEKYNNTPTKQLADKVAYEYAQFAKNNPNPAGKHQDYFNNLGEGEARAVAERSNMGQKALDQNPVDANYGIKNPIVQHEATQMASQEKQRGFVKSVKASPEVSAETQGLTNETYLTKSNKTLEENAKEFAKSPDSAQIAHDAMSVPAGKLDDQTVANVIEAAKKSDAEGKFEEASGLFDALAEHLTEAGRQVQAASLLSKRTPQGLLYSAQKQLKKAGIELTPEIKKSLEEGITKIKTAGAGKDRAIAEFEQRVQKLIPGDLSNNLIGVWKAGLLSGAKTQGGNALSNSTFAALKGASNPLSAGFDKAISLATGKRTKTATFKGIGKGFDQGVESAVDTLKTGIDPRNIGADKYQHKEINFKNPVIQKVLGNPSNLVFRAMGAADQPFYYASLKNNLYDIAKADGLNKGLKGSELNKYMDDLVKNPTDQIVEMADHAAQKAVLGQDNKVATAVSQFARKVPGGQVLVPFTKVPTNFISRVVDFTPAGAVKEAVTQIRKGKLDQRALSEALGEATTGSSVIFLGAELANSGQLSGDFPSDPKEQARWKAEGITPNSVKVGGNWYSLNYLGPAGLLLGAGKNIMEAHENGDNETATAIAGLGKGLMGQSFLQGLSGFSNAIQDPGRYGTNLAKSQVASAVPAWINDIGNATDNMQRDTAGGIAGVGNAVAARLPGIRTNLAPKQDSFGNDLKQAGGSGVNTAVNPLKPSQSTATPLTNELDRLKEAGQSIFPTTDKTLKVGKDTIKLNTKQQQQWNKDTGQQTQAAWNTLINSSEYKGLADDKKKQALQGIMDDINATSKVKFLQSIGNTDAASKAQEALSKRQTALLDGDQLDPVSYTSKKDTKSPKSSYESALKDYNKKKATMSSLDQLKTEKSLNTLKVKADYDQDVIDFYNLSNADKNAYFKRDPQKAKELYGKAKELGTKLGNAGSTNKLKNGIRTASATKGKKKGSKAKIAKTPKVSVPKITLAKSRKLAIAKPRKTQYAKISSAKTGNKVKLTA